MAQDDKGAPTRGADTAGGNFGEQTQVTDDSGKPNMDWTGAWIGITFWVAVIALGYWVFVHRGAAELFLDIRQQKPLLIKGVVTHDGKPVAGGVVRLVIEDAANDRFISSLVLPVDAKSGTFSTLEQSFLNDESAASALRVQAIFAGPGPSGNDVSGNATAHINYEPPFLGRHIWWTGFSFGFFIVLLLIFLFTGEMGKTKARLLFSVMYLMTFLSLAIPIWVALLLFQNKPLIAMMESAPIGVVKGRAEGLTEPQWLVNIGGTVFDAAAAAAPPKPPQAAAGDAASQPAQTGTPPTVAAAPPEKSATDAAVLGSRTVEVRGGLAIPFYVIALAMLGAGINLTRKVPEIQQRYDLNVLPQQDLLRRVMTRAATFGLVRRGPGPDLQEERPEVRNKVRKMAAAIRKELVENYMYLLSAPFLAVAVYYLLRILTTTGEVSQPILVLMAFATGLTSDTIVKAIIDFAKEKLERDPPKRREADTETEQAPPRPELQSGG